MFRSFFLSKFWFRWSWPGMGVIVLGTWYQVQVDVKINEWFGGFYDLIQKALSTPNSVQLSEFNSFLLTFGKIAGHLCCCCCFPQLFYKALDI